MADYNLGTAHGRILIDVDDKGSAKAAKSMQELDQDSAKASQRLEQFAQYCDQVEDRLQAVTNRLEAIDFTPIDNLAAANQRGGLTADQHRNKMIALTASIGEMGAVAAGAGSQGQKSLRQAGIGLVQTFGEVGRNVEQTSFKMELFNYTMNGLDKTVGRASRALDAINTPFRDLSGAGIKAYMAIDRVTNRFSAFAAAGQLVGAVASGVAAVALVKVAAVAVGLVAVIGQLTGVMGLVPGIAVAGGLAMGVWNTAMQGASGFASALAGDTEGMNKALKDSAPEMRTVANELKKLAPAVKNLKIDVQTRFWKGLGVPMRQMGERYLPMIQHSAGRVATGFNAGLKSVVSFMNEGRTIAEWNGILTKSATAVNAVTTRFGALAKIFHTLIAVSSEFLPALGQGLGAGIDRVSAFVTSAQGITKIRGWIQGGIDAVSKLGKAFGFIGTALGNVFKIADATGGGFLDKLVKMSGEVALFTQRTEGVKAIAGIFNVLKAASDAILPALLALVKVVGVQLAPGLAQLITLIGPKLVPFIEAFGDGIARMMSAVPELADMFNKLLDALTPLLPVLGQSIGDQIKFWQNFASIAMPIIQGLIDAFTALPVPVQSFLLAFAVLSPVIFKVIFTITKFMTILTLMATLTGKSSLAMRLLGIAPAQAGKRFVFLRRVIATLFSPFSKLIALGARLGKIKWLTAGLSKFASIAGPIGKVASAFTRFSNVGRVLLGLSKAASFLLQAFKIASILKFFGALISWPKRAAAAFLASTKRIIVASAQWVAATTRATVAMAKNAAVSTGAWIASAARATGAWIAMAARTTGAFIMTAARATGSAIASGAAWVMAGLRAAGAWIAMQARAFATFAMVQLRAALAATQSAAAWVMAGIRSAGAWLAMQIRALATFLMVQARAAISATMAAASWVAAGVRSAGAWLAMQIRALATFTMVAARAAVTALASGAAWVAAGVRAAGAWLAMQVRALATFTVVAARSAVSATVAGAAWLAAGARAAGAWVAMQIRAVASFVATAAASTASAATAAVGWLATNARIVASFVLMRVQALISMAITVAGVVAGWVVMGTQALIQAARMAAAWLIALGPVGIIIAVVIALVALIIMNWDRIKAWTIAAFTAVWAFLVNIWNQIKAWITTAILAVYMVIVTYLTLVKAFWTMVWNTFIQIVTTVWNGIKTAVQTAITFVQTIITTVMNVIRTIITTVWNAIRTTITTVVNAIRTVVTTVWNAIRTAVTTVVNAIRTVVTTVWNAISQAVTTAVNTIRSIVTSVFNAVKNFITTTWEAAKQLTINSWNAMRNAVNAGVAAVVGFVRGLVDKIKGFFSGAGQWLLAAGKAIMDGLLNGIKRAWEAVAGFLGGLANKIKNLKGPEKKDAKLLIDEGKAIIGGLHKGMEAKTSPMLKWVGDMADKVGAMANGARLSDKLGQLGKDAISRLAEGLRSSEDKVRDAIARVRETLQGVGNVPFNQIIDKVKSAASKAGVNLTPYLGSSAGSSSPETRAGNYLRPVTPAGATTAASATPRPGDTYNLYTTVPQGSTVKELSETITFDLRHAGKGVYR